MRFLKILLPLKSQTYSSPASIIFCSIKSPQLPLYGSGGCPTLFSWNGSAFVDYGVIDIHNSGGTDVTREVPVQTADVAINAYKAKFRLQEGWPSLNFSESLIDQVKLYSVDGQENRCLCPLIKAEHSQLGNVLYQLLLDDSVRTKTLLMETIDLTFIVPFPRESINHFTFFIDGCNSKVP